MLHIDVRGRAGEFEFEVREGLSASGCTGVFGPSGAGKTTLLRIIAGFQQSEGQIRFGDDIWLDSSAGKLIPPHRRRIGYVFQHGALFAHLRVRGNLEYALKRQQGPSAFTFDRVVTALELGTLLERQVQQLSGGEIQRVALGRALLSNPALMLLDEPLSALDVARKIDILPFLIRIREEFAVPMLHVSHNVDELVRVADRLLVLAGGRVQAHGETAQVLERLDVQSVTGRFEGGSVITVMVLRHDATRRLTVLRFGDTDITMPILERLESGQAVRLRIRSRDVALATERPRGISIRNIVAAEILEIAVEPESPYAEVLLESGGEHLRARITQDAVAELALRIGSKVFALIKGVIFDHRVL